MKIGYREWGKEEFQESSKSICSWQTSQYNLVILLLVLLKFPNVKIVTFIPLGFFFTTVRIPAVFFLGFWFLQQAFNSVAMLEAPANVGMEGGGVAYWAHAGGFIFGAILGPLLGLFSPDSNPPSYSSEPESF